ncbi:MAG: GH13_9 / GH13_8 / GH13 / GH13_10 / CBM 48 / GH13_36 [uncultured Thermomicrobiales bacterium]|uniref:1,4-alpha-glucan branching enzyme GlgB n=1 Tax=uncultured Thermomicrobiales bacterium TaxID=1645740 RepID=A0A6J4VC09_9BACT|nr:MAG: GH13_9 / GH13_8 / GH13 / GH13_10 / CBM 48 / GH13_36 [uncultured Thermomicrobiales bacterium]
MTATAMTHASAQIDALMAGMIGDPHAFLGMHLAELTEEPAVPAATAATPTKRRAAPKSALVVRAFLPGAEAVTVVERGGRRARVALAKIDAGGLFAGTIPGRKTHFAYDFEITRGEHTWTQGDPYRFLPTLGDLDLHLAGEGSHRRLYNVLGAHPRTLGDVAGISFAVWAPGARGVSLIGDFNGWHTRSLPLRALGASGIWELFMPGLVPGEVYKYAIRGADWVETQRADPVGFGSELRPKTASVIADLDRHQWADGAWMAARAAATPTVAPMSIYEVHLGSWRRRGDGSWLSYGEIADQLIPYVNDLGFTHIELLPVAEHPYDPSWGYQITGFYAPTSRFGTPEDFQMFVDRFHQAGIGVILDWVPAHFAIDAHALGRFDGTFLYEHEDWRRRTQPDWGTFAFNYGRNEVRNFLLANALYWLDKYHIDGLRVDAVSAMLYLDYSRKSGEWAPNRYGGREHLEAIDFLRAFNDLVRDEGRGAITIAEESTSWPAVSRPTETGGLGFNFKWDMGWMHDTLEYMGRDPVYRQYDQNKLTFRQMYAYSENFILSLSHDEVVHLKRSLLHKMPGDEWQQFANLRLLFAYQHAQPGKKLVFMGGEFGQRREWNHDTGLAWSSLSHGPHAAVQGLVRDLNRLHRDESALHALDHDHAGFDWLDFRDAQQSTLSFVRRGVPSPTPQPSGESAAVQPEPQPGDHIVCAFNFTPVPRLGYRIPVPEPIRYREILNTDAEVYGGGGIGNFGTAQGEAVQHHDHPNSMLVNLPPLAAVYFKPEW